MPMSLSPAAERMVAAQRALLETSHRLGLAALDGTTKLYRLQFQATQQLLAAGKPGVTEAGTAADGAVATPAAAGAAGASLLKDMMEIVTATGGEVARIMAEQGSALRSTLVPAAGEAANAVASPVQADVASAAQGKSPVSTEAAGATELPTKAPGPEQSVASTIVSTGATMPVAPLPPSGTASAVASAFGAPAPKADPH